MLHETALDKQTELILLLKEEKTRVHEVLQTMHKEQRRVMGEQWQTGQDMSGMFETNREMALAVARLEKRPAEGKTLV